MNSNKKTVVILFIIFLVALLLRIWKLGTLPHDPYEDEIMSGYVGRFILQNGKDLYGNAWPLLYFNKFGDYYIILPMYLSGISTFLFGMTVFATRFPAALIGAFAVFPVYLFSSELFKNNKVALLSAFFLAITPWHIVLSRASAEGVIGSTVFLLGVYFLYVAIARLNVMKLYVASGFFLLSYFIYHPFRVYTPIVMAGSFLIFGLAKKIKMNRTFTLLFIVLTVVFCTLTFYIATTPWGRGRFAQTSVLGAQSGVAIKINTASYADKSILEARVFHNKVVMYGREFLKQYVHYLSPEFLFLDGGQFSRYSIYENGLFYIAFFFALFALIKSKTVPRKNTKGVLFLIFLIAISILPAALTVVESPNIHRSVFLSLLLCPVFALAFIAAWEKRVKWMSYGLLLSIVVLFEFFYFWHQYSVHTDSYVSVKRNTAQVEIINYVLHNQNKFNSIYITGNGTMPMYYLFFKKDLNPNYASQFKSDLHISQIDNIHFVFSDCPADQLKAPSLPKKSIVIQPNYCTIPQSYTQHGMHTGINSLIGYQVLLPSTTAK